LRARLRSQCAPPRAPLPRSVRGPP
jgi:hypothetical protein